MQLAIHTLLLLLLLLLQRDALAAPPAPAQMACDTSGALTVPDCLRFVIHRIPYGF
eukprot:SAG31_NODE_8808_length_1384_cov_0.792218_1_plen_56_part_00